MIVFSWQEMPITLSIDESQIIDSSELTIITTESGPAARAVAWQTVTVAPEPVDASISEHVIAIPEFRAMFAPELPTIVPESPTIVPEQHPATIAPKIALPNCSIPRTPHVTHEAPTPENPPWPPSRAN